MTYTKEYVAYWEVVFATTKSEALKQKAETLLKALKEKE
jgi:hypothetical protein